jgi:hypothetical protein
MNLFALVTIATILLAFLVGRYDVPEQLISALLIVDALALIFQWWASRKVIQAANELAHELRLEKNETPIKSRRGYFYFQEVVCNFQ